MKEEKNEDELFELLTNNYLDKEQMDNLIDIYSDKATSYCQSICENDLPFSDIFIKEISAWWATEELIYTEIYQNYIRQMLIKPDFAYHLRDYYILYIYRDDFNN